MDLTWLLFLRVTTPISGHVLTWIPIFLCLIYLLKKTPFPRNVFLFFAIMGFDEGLWELTYAFVNPSYFQFIFYLASFWAGWFGIVAFLWFKLYKYFNLQKLFVSFAIMAIFSIYWISIGFPVTDILNKPTEFYYNPFVNLLEIFQWVLGMTLYAWSVNTSKMPSNQTLSKLRKQL